MKKYVKRLSGVVPAIFLIAAVVFALTPSMANAAKPLAVAKPKPTTTTTTAKPTTTTTGPTTTTTMPSALLMVVKAGDGTGTVTNYGTAMNCSGSTCTQTYTPPGSTVELNAAAASGSVFAGWSGGPCTGTGPCSFQIFQNTTVTATFTKSNTVGLDVAVLYDDNGGGAGGAQITSSPAGIMCGYNSDCSDTYPVGTSVTLTIELGSDTELAGWSGACTGTALTCTITMDDSKSASAQLRYVGSFP